MGWNRSQNTWKDAAATCVCTHGYFVMHACVRALLCADCISRANKNLRTVWSSVRTSACHCLTKCCYAFTQTCGRRFWCCAAGSQSARCATLRVIWTCSVVDLFILVNQGRQHWAIFCLPDRKFKEEEEEEEEEGEELGKMVNCVV